MKQTNLKDTVQEEDLSQWDQLISLLSQFKQQNIQTPQESDLIIQILLQVDAFRILSQESEIKEILNKIKEFIEIQDYLHGVPLLQWGEKSKNLHFIVKGRVAQFKRKSDEELEKEIFWNEQQKHQVGKQEIVQEVLEFYKSKKEYDDLLKKQGLNRKKYFYKNNICSFSFQQLLGPGNSYGDLGNLKDGPLMALDDVKVMMIPYYIFQKYFSNLLAKRQWVSQFLKDQFGAREKQKCFVQLAHLFKEVKLEKKKFLYQQGQKANKIYIFKQGTFSIQYHAQQDSPQINNKKQNYFSNNQSAISNHTIFNNSANNSNNTSLIQNNYMQHYEIQQIQLVSTFLGIEEVFTQNTRLVSVQALGENEENIVYEINSQLFQNNLDLELIEQFKQICLRAFQELNQAVQFYKQEFLKDFQMQEQSKKFGKLILEKQKTQILLKLKKQEKINLDQNISQQLPSKILVNQQLSTINKSSSQNNLFSESQNNFFQSKNYNNNPIPEVQPFIVRSNSRQNSRNQIKINIQSDLDENQINNKISNFNSENYTKNPKQQSISQISNIQDQQSQQQKSNFQKKLKSSSLYCLETQKKLPQYKNLVNQLARSINFSKPHKLITLTSLQDSQEPGSNNNKQTQSQNEIFNQKISLGQNLSPDTLRNIEIQPNFQIKPFQKNVKIVDSSEFSAMTEDLKKKLIENFKKNPYSSHNLLLSSLDLKKHISPFNSQFSNTHYYSGTHSRNLSLNNPFQSSNNQIYQKNKIVQFQE